MSNKILKLFIEKGFLLDKDMLNFFSELEDEDLANEIINKVGVVSHQKVITKNLINENIDKFKPVFTELDSEKQKVIEKFFVNVSVSVEVKRERSVEDIKKNEVDDSGVVKILSSPVLASQKLVVKDFVRHFRNRYNFFRNLLQEKSEILTGLTSIDKIGGNRDFSIIGIVSDKRITKNKNIFLEVEDLTGRTKLLITQNKEEIFEKAKEIVLDDVVGFRCSGSGDFIFVNDLVYPDASLGVKKRSENEGYVLFISDMHIGSGNFLENNFKRFIDWLNGVGADEKQKQMLKKIKYLFITGDSIDGVGIYPGQEKDLVIKDIKGQYVKLAEYLDRIPKHIRIIQCAGQHDAVRVAEPQPPLTEEFAEPLHKIENLYLVSNPSLVEIDGSEDKEGFKVLMYHGASMHGLVNEIEELRLNDGHHTPARVVKHLLKRRHLAPSHGAGTIYIPNAEKDSMIIREVPDIITTGDFHRCDIDNYNGVLIFCCGCWQSMTAFEEKVGNDPDPGKVPMFNLKTREIKILDFSDGDDKICKEKEDKIVCEVENENRN